MLSEATRSALRTFVRTPGASTEALAPLRTVPMPAEYLDFLAWANGGEGFAGDDYLALWSAEEVSNLNPAYQVDVYAPGLLLFGSSGGGEAFAFDLRCGAWNVVRVPFVGMDLSLADEVAGSFDAFVEQVFVGRVVRKDSHLTGREIFEIQPVILGGSPTDPRNKTIVSRQQHVAAVRYWNKIVTDLRVPR